MLTAVNAAADRASLYPGLGLADGRAICPRLLTLPAAPKKDREALLDLGRWASCRYSPTLNADGDDGLWLEVSGVPHLFGGEQALLADLGRRLNRLGFTARLALAETLGGAHALARYARPSLIVPEGEIAPALAPLPVEALRLEPEITVLLRRLGLKRIGQLYDLPRATLERRFHSKDTAEAVLDRLDQALGRRREPRVPLLPSPDFAARLPFPEPLITHDGVLAGLEHLAAELCSKLARAGRGCRRLALWVARADGSSTVIEAGLSAPSREPSHLLRLVEDKIEALDMGFGVDLMALTALVTEPLRPAQATLAEPNGRVAPETLIDRLVNRLGARAVRRLVPRGSHIPELAQSLRAPSPAPRSGPRLPHISRSGRRSCLRALSLWPWWRRSRKGRRRASFGGASAAAWSRRKGLSASRPNGGVSPPPARSRRGRATITASRTKTDTATGCSATASIRRASSHHPRGICTACSHERIPCATPSLRSPPISRSCAAAPIPRSWWQRPRHSISRQ